MRLYKKKKKNEKKDYENYLKEDIPMQGDKRLLIFEHTHLSIADFIFGGPGSALTRFTSASTLLTRDSTPARPERRAKRFIYIDELNIMIL